MTLLKSLITSLSDPSRPTFLEHRRDSASSLTSDSTCESSGPDTELQPWKYTRRHSDSEQDEVRRKRHELAEKRRRASDAAWREFWP
jgi:hypothetical protein